MNTNIQQTNIQYREITISQLPENCALRVQVERWVNDVNRASVFVVAKADNLTDWIVYIGYPRLDMIKKECSDFPTIIYLCSTLSSLEQVKRLGNVLDRQSAEQLFPEWSYRRYRE